MMRGLIVFYTALFSIAFLRRRLYRHHFTSLLLIVGGVAIVGVGPIVLKSQGEASRTDAEVLGILLIVLSQLFHGLMFVSEEKILSKFYVKPLKMVGMEGVWGFLVYCLFLVIVQPIQCYSADFCPYGYIEDSIDAIYQLSNNKTLLVLVISVMFSIAMYNFCGLSVTKYGSAAQRSTLDIARTSLIWMFFLVYPGQERKRSTTCS